MSETASTLVVGCGAMLLHGLRGNVPDGSVLVLEDPELLERQRGGPREEASRLPVVAGVVPGPYLRALDARVLVELLPAADRIRRVVPGTDEISAIVAAAVAAELGLPGAGVRAATIFRDKLELRAAAHAAGLAGPRWHQVTDLDDLRAKAADLGGGELVLKPSARSGSTGVLLLDPGDDLAAAWAETTSAQGLVRMADLPPSRYLVEQRMHGPEVSVECLVAAGELVYTNVTAKRVLPGRYPVEMGHTVPAPLDEAVVKDLCTAMQALVEATGYGFGVLHGEWILRGDGPALVECAARIPGDEITTLISLAYGAPFIERYTSVMSGDLAAARTAMPERASRFSAIHFLAARAGTVEAVRGVAEAAAMPGVHEVAVEVEPGAEVVAPRTSSERIGHVIAVGPDAEAARGAAERAAAAIEVVLR